MIRFIKLPGHPVETWINVNAIEKISFENGRAAIDLHHCSYYVEGGSMLDVLRAISGCPDWYLHEAQENGAIDIGAPPSFPSVIETRPARDGAAGW